MTFNFALWLIPFDRTSWILLILSTLSIIAIVKGRWFEIYAILMRQECRILKGKQKMLILFIAASVVFTYGYEGVISSLLIVPPPVQTLDSLKELLEQNYKIGVRFLDDADYLLAKTVFKQENISARIESVAVRRGNSTSKEDAQLSGCDFSIRVKKDEELRVHQLRMRQRKPPVFCHITKNTAMSGNQDIYFLGHSHSQLATNTKRITESGIFSFCLNFIKYYRFVFLLQSAQISKNFKSEGLEAFRIEDWKILSIFVMWTTGLAFALLVFAFECLFQKRTRLQIHLIGICNVTQFYNRVHKWQLWPRVCVKYVETCLAVSNHRCLQLLGFG